MEKLSNKVLHHLMAVYINNNLHVSILQSAINRQKLFLKARFGLEEHRLPKMILGIQTKPLKDRLWYLSQPTNLCSIIKKFLSNQTSCTVHIPMQPGLQLPKPDKLCPPEQCKVYLSIIDCSSAPWEQLT